MTELSIVPRQEEPELTPYEVIERVITSGDLTNMDPEARVAFYWRTCESLGLNPLTRPLEYLNLEGKLTLYVRKDATDQLRRINRVSITKLERDIDDALGLLTVTAYGRTPDGREDAATGSVSIKGLGGNHLANTMMKAETKAKRRLTLALVGLGFLDESEVEGLGGQRVDPDELDGDARPAPATLLEQVTRQAEALTQSEPEEEAAPGTVEPEGEPDGPMEVIPDEVAELLAEPMTPEVSAAVPDEIDELVDEIADEAGLTEAARPATPGMTVQKLAELAKAAQMGKLAFAGALDVVPADVGPKIEAMTDAERYRLAQSLGLVG